MGLLRYWPPTAHLAAVAACVATAWWRIETAPEAPDAMAAPQDAGASAPAIAAMAAGTGARDSEADVEAVAARALFRPGRPPADPEPAVEAEAAPTDAEPEPATASALPEFRMVGYLEEDGRRSAILQTVGDGLSQIVQEGDEVGGARVERIEPDAVVMESDGRRVTVKLYPD